ARPACGEQHRAAVLRLPDEVAADRPAQLDAVAGVELVGQVRRDLAVVEPLDREVDAGALGGRGDRVAALGHVAVLGREPDGDVLAGPVAGPALDVEADRLDPRGLYRAVDDRRGLPRQSPQY